MSDYDALGTITRSTRDNADLIFNLVMNQTAGVGGSGGDYQTTVAGECPQSLIDGFILGRIISGSYTATKTGIAGTVGGWPIHIDVAQSDISGSFSFNSNNNLNSGTSYDGAAMWLSTTYYNRIYVDGTHTLSDAINDTAGDGGVTVYPSGDDIVVSNSVVVSGTTSPATDITFNGSISETASAGAVVGTLSADRNNGSFSEVAPTSSNFEISGNQVIVSSGASLSAGSENMGIRYDNSGVSGGGTYDETISITITADTGSTSRYLAVPTTTADVDGQDLTIAELSSLLSGMTNSGSGWTSGMTTLGLATTGVDPVIDLDEDALGNLSLSNIGPFVDSNTDPRFVHIRGKGTYSRNSWQPTSTCTVNSISLSNCEHLRFWLIRAEGTHSITGCDDIEFNRCPINGQVAESSAAAALSPSVGAGIHLSGSTNITFRQCTFMGYDKKVFWGANVSSDMTDITVKECIFDQLGGCDPFNFGSCVADRWTLEYLFGTGNWRNPKTAHRDFVHCQSNAVLRDWNLSYIWKAMMGHWGNKGNNNMKMNQYENATGFMSGFSYTQCFSADGGNFCSAGLGASSQATYLAQFHPPDILNDENTENPNAKLNGKFSLNISNPPTNPSDFHIVTRSNGVDEGEQGPNGVWIQDSGFFAADRDGVFGTWDFSEYANWFENYQTSTAANARTSHIPRHTYGISGWKAKTGSRLHWDHANPAGAWQLQEWLFDSVTHDNPWDWGWPTCALFALRYDPENGCGGAGANTNGTVFDADGD